MASARKAVAIGREACAESQDLLQGDAAPEAITSERGKQELAGRVHAVRPVQYAKQGCTCEVKMMSKFRRCASRGALRMAFMDMTMAMAIGKTMVLIGICFDQ